MKRKYEIDRKPLGTKTGAPAGCLVPGVQCGLTHSLSTFLSCSCACISCFPLALCFVITFSETDVLLCMMHYDGRPGFDSLHEQEISLYSTPSGPAVGPTQSPVQWIPGSLSLGVKRAEREAGH